MPREGEGAPVYLALSGILSRIVLELAGTQARDNKKMQGHKDTEDILDKNDKGRGSMFGFENVFERQGGGLWIW